MRTPFPGGHYHVDFYPFMALLCGFSTQGLIAVHVFQLDTSEVVLHELFCVFFLPLSMATVRLNLWMDALGHFQSRGPQLYCHIVVFRFCFPPPPVIQLLWKMPPGPQLLMCCAHVWKSPFGTHLCEVALFRRRAHRPTTRDCSPKRWCHFSLPEAIFKSFHCSTSLSAYDSISYFFPLIFHAS